MSNFEIPNDVVEYVKVRMGLESDEDAENEIKRRCEDLEELYFQGGRRFLWTDIDRRIVFVLAKNGAKQMKQPATRDIKEFDEHLLKVGKKVWSGVLSNLESFVEFCFKDMKFAEFKTICGQFMAKYKPAQVDVFAELLELGSNMCTNDGFPDYTYRPDGFKERCILEALDYADKSVPDKLKKVAKNRLALISRYVQNLASKKEENESGFEKS